MVAVSVAVAVRVLAIVTAVVGLVVVAVEVAIPSGLPFKKSALAIVVDNALIVVILAEDAVKVVVVVMVMALVGSAGLSIWMGPGIVGPALAKTSRSARPGPDLGM